MKSTPRGSIAFAQSPDAAATKDTVSTGYFVDKAQLTSGAGHGVKPVDPDLAEQAIPGHGVLSQDPDATAQFRLSPEEAKRESKSVLVGGGLVAGLAAGAAADAAVAGPVGILVGGTLGAVAGVVGSGAVGGLVNAKSTTLADNGPNDAQDIKRSATPG